MKIMTALTQGYKNDVIDLNFLKMLIIVVINIQTYTLLF